LSFIENDHSLAGYGSVGKAQLLLLQLTRYSVGMANSVHWLSTRKGVNVCRSRLSHVAQLGV
jgi:hypothetical protein